MTASSPESPKRQPGESETDWERRVNRLKRGTVLEVMETLGFDVDDVNEMQKDALFLRKMRKASETTQAKLWAAILTLIVGVAGSLLTLWVQSMGQK